MIYFYDIFLSYISKTHFYNTVALGEKLAGMYANHPDLAKDLVSAGQRSDEGFINIYKNILIFTHI